MKEHNYITQHYNQKYIKVKKNLRFLSGNERVSYLAMTNPITL